MEQGTGKRKIVILGLGNRLMGDDAVGIHVVERLKPKYSEIAKVVSTEEAGLSLLDFLSGYDTAIIVDSISRNDASAKLVDTFRLADFPPIRHKSNHYIGLPEIAQMASQLNIPFPEEVHILGIRVEEPHQISDSLSMQLIADLPTIQEEVERIVNQIIYKSADRKKATRAIQS